MLKSRPGGGAPPAPPQRLLVLFLQTWGRYRHPHVHTLPRQRRPGAAVRARGGALTVSREPCTKSRCLEAVSASRPRGTEDLLGPNSPQKFPRSPPPGRREQERDRLLRHLPPKHGRLDLTKTQGKLQNGAYKDLGGWNILFSWGVGGWGKRWGSNGGKWKNVICPLNSTQKVCISKGNSPDRQRGQGRLHAGSHPTPSSGCSTSFG